MQVAASGLGDIVTDADGNTLYLFIPDGQGPSVCNDGCAAAWPSLEGEPVAGNGIDGTLLGTAERADGTTQATYNGWPLYYFANDAAPGDTNGQSVNDVWWTITPAGDAMMDAATMGPTIQVAASGLGDIVTDADGNTLYLFIPDGQGPSVCNDGCAAAWPSLEGEPVAGNGIDGTLLGTAERADGTTQATYNGWPLYYFANDAAPGDTNGQSVNDVWWTITPAGDAMM